MIIEHQTNKTVSIIKYNMTTVALMMGRGGVCVCVLVWKMTMFTLGTKWQTDFFSSSYERCMKQQGRMRCGYPQSIQ